MLESNALNFHGAKISLAIEGVYRPFFVKDVGPETRFSGLRFFCKVRSRICNGIHHAVIYQWDKKITLSIWK